MEVMNNSEQFAPSHKSAKYADNANSGGIGVSIGTKKSYRRMMSKPFRDQKPST